MTNINIIVIPAAGPARNAIMLNTLNAAQNLVDGYIEGLPSGDGWFAYCNEEGKLRDLPGNINATLYLGRAAGHNQLDLIAGDVIIVGADTEGEWVDVPGNLIDEVTALNVSS